MRQRFAGGAHRLLLLVLLAGLLSAFVVGCGGSDSTDTPAIVTQPTAVSAAVGTPASFSVVASGASPLTYQWFHNSVAVSGATGATYSIASVSSDSTGNYYVVVSNAQGAATSNTVALTLPGVAPPVITTQPVSQSVTNGASATFTVVATSATPLTYQWFRAGTAIAGATNATYTIATTTPTSAGSYYVVVTNAGGSATSNTALLSVNSGTVAPSIVTQPTPQTVGLGSSATFSVVATGDTPLTYQWFKGATAIAGATSANYTIAAVAAGDVASYHVVVTNAAGSATSNTVTLTIGAGSTGGAIVTVH